MKTQTAKLINLLTKNEMNRLTTQVQETIALGENPQPVKTFSSADLWNIQRQRKGFGSRRSFLY